MSNQRAEDLIRYFYQISGMEVVVQNANFRTVTSKRCLPGNLCTLIHRAPICLDMCRASDKERFALASESREPLIYICPFGALLAGVMFFWVMKKETALDAVNLGSDKKIGGWFYPFGKFVYVPLCVVCLVAGAILGDIG